MVLSPIGRYLHDCSCTIWAVVWVCVVAMGYSRVIVKTLTNFLLLVFVLIELRVVISDNGIFTVYVFGSWLDPWRGCKFNFVGWVRWWHPL